MTTNGEYATFWEHVEALRNTLLKMIATIFISSLIAFYFYPALISLLTSNLPANERRSTSLMTEPIQQLRITNQSNEYLLYTLPLEARLLTSTSMTKTGELLLKPGESAEFSQPMSSKKLLILSPTEGFLTALKVSFWLGLALSSPIWLYFLMTFIAPALHEGEKKIALPFLFASIAFFFAGVAFSYSFTLPIANGYFSLFNEQIGINSWSLSHYLDYTLILMISNGLAFEIAVILIFLVHYGIITGQQLVNQRRPVIVAAFILSALLTPPDVVTQLMLAVPLVLIYEAAILYAKMSTKINPLCEVRP